MKNIIGGALLSVAAIALPGLASAAPAEGYVAEVTVKRGEEVVAHSKGVAGANGILRNVAEDSRSYRKSVTANRDKQAPDRATDTLRTGMSYDIALSNEGGELTVDADVAYRELAAMNTFSVAGETVDLPDVNAWSLAESGVARRDGNGWRYEAGNDPKGLSLTVVLRPAGS